MSTRTTFAMNSVRVAVVVCVVVFCSGSPEEKEEEDGKKKPGSSGKAAAKPAASAKKPGAKGKAGAGEEVPVGDKGTLVLAAALPGCLALRSLDLSGGSTCVCVQPPSLSTVPLQSVCEPVVHGPRCCVAQLTRSIPLEQRPWRQP